MLFRSKGLAFVLAQYFFHKERWWFWGLFALLLSAYVVNIRFAIELNDWNGRFYNALQAVDMQAIYRELLFFVGLASIIIVLLVSASYLKDRLIIAIRRDITKIFFNRWLSLSGAHFVLKDSLAEPDNPDQRMTEDVKGLVSLSINLCLSLFDSLLTIGSFSIILWHLSGAITLFGYTIEGYMFWACLAYTAVSTLVTHLIGRKLKLFNIEVQHKEADLRAAVIDKRRNAAAIAGAKGEAREVEDLSGRFDSLMQRLIALVKKKRDLDLFTVGIGQVTHLAPIFFALPTFLAGGIQLGGLMQIRGAFSDVARSLSWVIFAYDDLAKLAATYERLKRLEAGLDAAEKQHQSILHQREVQTIGVRLCGCLDVPTHDTNQMRVIDIDMYVEPGELVILTGESGIGKSTLLKAIASFSQSFQGTMVVASHILWMPQTSYVITGTLRENLAYPKPATTLDEAEAIRLLDIMGLSALHSRLNERQEWSVVLSGGEQQRLCLARALHSRPDVLLLDESFSGLDDKNALAILSELKQQLPYTAMILVTHQRTLFEYADRVYTLETTTKEKLG